MRKRCRAATWGGERGGYAAKSRAHLLLVVQEVLVGEQLFRIFRQIGVAGAKYSLAAKAVADERLAKHACFFAFFASVARH